MKSGNLLQTAITVEYAWLEKVKVLMCSESLTDGENIAWAVFHAHKQPNQSVHVARSTLLSPFRDSSHSVAMIRHTMDIVKSAVSCLNTGQTPVLALDQPVQKFVNRFSGIGHQVMTRNTLL